MPYYTERNGMRRQTAGTYEVFVDRYSLLFRCCEKYYNNLAWLCPEQCPDGKGCCGVDREGLSFRLKYEIPDLYRDCCDVIAVPSNHWNVFDEEIRSDKYNQYALFDFIEFVAKNCRDVRITEHHGYFNHNHMHLLKSDGVWLEFQAEINDILAMTGLLYRLADNREIERIVENTPLTPSIEHLVSAIKEQGTAQLLQEAIALHRGPSPTAARDAAEKIWDAFERLKSYYSSLGKKQSVEKVVRDTANGTSELEKLLTDEYRALTKIGNDFRIRHHETNTIDIADSRHYDYFFNRCLSLTALSIQYLE